jgi:hypothetical protein
MAYIRISSADAIQVYTLAVAYLFNAKIGNCDLTSTLYAKEMWSGVFHVWCREHTSREQPIVPVAICVYRRENQVWKIELVCGEKLALLDRGNVWDIVENEEMLLIERFIHKRCGSQVQGRR